MVGKSASREGSELLTFRLLLATSITKLKDMVGKFDQLEEIVTQLGRKAMMPWKTMQPMMTIIVPLNIRQVNNSNLTSSGEGRQKKELNSIAEKNANAGES